MQFSQLQRREFITLLGGAAAVWPLAARAQQPVKLPTIGFLGAATSSSYGQWVAAFVQRLRELGWIEGRTTRRRPRQPPSRISLSAAMPSRRYGFACATATGLVSGDVPIRYRASKLVA